MKDEGKEKTRGVAVLGVLRPDGFFIFQSISLKCRVLSVGIPAKKIEVLSFSK